MPFYDEFDLSTVDVLLISQYVLTCSLCLSPWWLGGVVVHHGSQGWRTAVALPRSTFCTSETMEYICIIPTRPR